MVLICLEQRAYSWSSNDFNFIEINEEHTTGSSIMPQKRNPDAAELIRGKSNRLVGNLVNLTTLLVSLPLFIVKTYKKIKSQYLIHLKISRIVY